MTDCADVNTYEQALQFLGADETISDEFIPSLVKVKVRCPSSAVNNIQEYLCMPSQRSTGRKNRLKVVPFCISVVVQFEELCHQ